MIWSRLRKEWDERFAPLMSPSRADWIFAVRTTAAGVLALVIAYALNLDHPQWAMITVFIVAQPVAGMVLAKGFYRLFGTLVGAVAAIAITLMFGANPWLFVGVLALWIGLCTFVSSLLRNPEAYGAALAGYTAMIIGLASFGNPHFVIDLSVARCTEIVLGIVCAGVTSRLILPQLARDAIGERLKRCILDLAAYANGAFARDDRVKLEALYRKLIVDTQTLGEMRAYARLEAPSLATRAYPVRRTIGNLLSALSAARALYTHAAPLNAALKPVRDELKTVVGELATAPEALDNTAPWIARLDAVERTSHIVPKVEDGADRVGTFTRLTIAGEFAEALRESLRGLDALRAPGRGSKREGKQPPLIIHRDHRGAIINAIRATVATMLVATFWLTTQWTNAAGAVIIVAVVSSLFAARPNPVQVAWGFFKGALLALPFAFVVGQLILPAIPGVGWFALFTAPVLVATALAMANPSYVGAATAFAINFIAFISHQYPIMKYDPAAFFVGAGAVLIGILLATGVFVVLFPARALAGVRRIVAAMREDLIRLCLHERLPRRAAYEGLAYDRVNQLLPLLPRSGKRGEALFGGSISAVTVGLEILRLRRAQQATTMPADVSQSIGNFMKILARDLLVQPSGDNRIVAVEDARLRSASIAAEHDNEDVMQVAASLRIIAAAMEDYPAFFAKTAT